MQALCKIGNLQRTLYYTQISRLLCSCSCSYSCTELMPFNGNLLPLKVRSHAVFKLKSANFSTSPELNGALASMKKRISNMVSASTKAKVGACMAYEKCADTINFNEFFKYFDLPDTFQSWFLIVQLHVWMCSLILISESNGRVFRNHIMEAMWVDVETRLNQLKEVKRSSRKQFLSQISDQFRASQIAYDEGIESDTVLASAVWRTIFNYRDMDPRVLEAMVFYIRKQIYHLDHQNVEEMMFRGAINFLPLKEVIDKMNTS